MLNAGTNSQYTSHSTRSAATAANKGVPVEDNLGAADWSSETTVLSTSLTISKFTTEICQEYHGFCLNSEACLPVTRTIKCLKKGTSNIQLHSTKITTKKMKKNKMNGCHIVNHTYNI